MFDIIYVTWFVQLASLVWGKFWYLYLIVSASPLRTHSIARVHSCDCVLTRSSSVVVSSMQIPGYACSVIYQKVLLPYLFRGQSPFASLQNMLKGGASGAQGAGAGAQQQGETLSKRQQKLQARAAKGDPRVQMRKR